MLESRTPWGATGEQICVIGTGYVGLTAGACLAFLGHDVTCTDVSEERVATLRRGEVPFLEAGLPELVRQMVQSGRLRFSTSNTDSVVDADFVFLCLPTPQGDDGAADLSAVCRVADEIGQHVKPGACVVNKSTVPVGTAQVVADALGRDDIAVVSNPEFLAEGSALKNFLTPDRVVVGSDDIDAAKKVAGLYDRIDTQVFVMDAASAETVKYAANTYLAVRLSFVNSMAGVCEAAGADVQSVLQAVGADSRIGPAFLKPGPGWGGSCFPKDTAALVHTSRESGYRFRLLEAAVSANASHHGWVADKIERAAGGDLRGKTVALWGLTFKAGTDDLRDSAAIAIARDLVARGAVVRGYDPTVTRPIEGIDVVASALAACGGAHVLFVGTEWPEFAERSLDDVAAVMASRAIVDGRNMLRADEAASLGFGYEGIGLRTTGRSGSGVEALRQAS